VCARVHFLRGSQVEAGHRLELESLVVCLREENKRLEGRLQSAEEAAATLHQEIRGDTRSVTQVTAALHALVQMLSCAGFLKSGHLRRMHCSCGVGPVSSRDETSLLG